jgi:6-phospho-3-hexuloisomerase
MDLKVEYETILSEINSVLDASKFDELEDFTNKIVSANRIVVFGAGRVGLMMKTFAMRLSHLNLECYFIGDLNLPRMKQGDLIVIGSGSGNTKSVVTIAEIAKSNGLDMISITSNMESSIAKLSSSLIYLKCRTKDTLDKKRESIQPMTTLFEQALLIFLDSLVLILMKKMNENHDSMLERHNVVE